MVCMIPSLQSAWSAFWGDRKWTGWDDRWIMVRVFPKLANQPNKMALTICNSISRNTPKGCLPFTQKFRKFRMECKWKDKFGLPERKFSRENRISWKVDQNSQGEFPNVRAVCHFLLVPGLLALVAFDPLPSKSRRNGTSASPWKFPFGIWRVPFTTIVDQPLFKQSWYIYIYTKLYFHVQFEHSTGMSCYSCNCACSLAR